MHDRRPEPPASLSLEKLAYYQWRESWSGYEDLDPNVDEDRQLRHDLRIDPEDDLKWNRIKESEFRVEF